MHYKALELVVWSFFGSWSLDVGAFILNGAVKPQRTQRGGAATQTRPRNASHKEAQKAQKGIPFVALVPFCGQENLVGLKRFGGIAVQRTQRDMRFRPNVLTLTGENSLSVKLPSLRSLRSLRFTNGRFQVHSSSKVHRPWSRGPFVATFVATFVTNRAGQRFSPEGTSENSPAFQRWDSNPKGSQVPKGRKNRAGIMGFCRP